MDSNGNPLFARDRNGDGLADRNADGVVQLDPNGIAFNEDVKFSGWRPFGKSQTRPHGNNSNGSFKQNARERSFRAAFDVNFTVPFIEGWDGVASAMLSEEYSTWRENNQSFSAIEQGLSCDVLLERNACFNPFAVNPNVIDPVSYTHLTLPTKA